MESKIKYPSFDSFRGKLMVAWWVDKEFHMEEFAKGEIKSAQKLYDKLKRMEAKQGNG